MTRTPDTEPIHGSHPEREAEQGIALIMGILFTIIISGLVVTGTAIMKSHRENTETSFRLNGQASQFARAGLIEAMAWFRKQSSQPVLDFEPELDPTARPPVLDTIDPEIGMAREFPIAGQIWGRYEVWKEWDTDPDPGRLTWRQAMQTEDITVQSGAVGSGTVWSVQSAGYVFRRADPGVAYNEYPNRVLGTDILGSEIRRMTLAPPGQAAVCVRNPCTTSINGNVSILAGTTASGIYSAQNSSCWVNTVGSPTIIGTPEIAQSTTYNDSVEAVFGVSEKNLEALADDRITTTQGFPSPLETNGLYYVDVPTLSLDGTQPLLGTAAVYVKGDVVLQPGNTSLFTGLLYVDGDLTIHEPAEISGTVICTGKVQIQGKSDWVRITYDDLALNSLRQAIGQYRLSAAFRKVLSAE